LHLAAAVGATGVFVAAAAVGATQTRQQAALVSTPVIQTPVRARTPEARPKPQVVVATPTSADQTSPPVATPRLRGTSSVRPERSLAGTIKDVQPDALDVVGVGGREWRVEPAPGALIRLNGKTARLDSLQPGDGVVILGQAQAGPGLRFLAHAITARSK
jgi:hypothetical protein